MEVLVNLGALYGEWSKLSLAEQTFQRALAEYEGDVRLNHPSKFEMLYNLGLIYYDQNNPAKAEEMLKEAWLGYTQVLGPDHSDTLRSAFHLGNAYRTQSKLELAEEMFQRALEGNEKMLGPDHPLCLCAAESLSSVYLRQKKLMEAKGMLWRVIIGVAKDQSQHQTQATEAIFKLGKVFHAENQLGAAEKAYRKALEGYKITLGLEHPATLIAATNLASLSRYQGRPAAVVSTCQRIRTVILRHSTEAAQSSCINMQR